MCIEKNDEFVNDENMSSSAGTSSSTKKRGVAVAIASAMLLGFLAIFGMTQASATDDIGGYQGGWHHVEVPTNPQPVGTPCTDPDGDGWGWDGYQSCKMGDHDQVRDQFDDFYDFRVDNEGPQMGEDEPTWISGVAEITRVRCVDNDGDGWGWAEYNGEGASCQGRFHTFSDYR